MSTKKSAYQTPIFYFNEPESVQQSAEQGFDLRQDFNQF